MKHELKEIIISENKNSKEFGKKYKYQLSYKDEKDIYTTYSNSPNNDLGRRITGMNLIFTNQDYSKVVFEQYFSHNLNLSIFRPFYIDLDTMEVNNIKDAVNLAILNICCIVRDSKYQCNIYKDICESISHIILNNVYIKYVNTDSVMVNVVVVVNDNAINKIMSLTSLYDLNDRKIICDDTHTIIKKYVHSAYDAENTLSLDLYSESLHTSEFNDLLCVVTNKCSSLPIRKIEENSIQQESENDDIDSIIIKIYANNKSQMLSINGSYNYTFKYSFKKSEVVDKIGFPLESIIQSIKNDCGTIDRETSNLLSNIILCIYGYAGVGGKIDMHNLRCNISALDKYIALSKIPNAKWIDIK